MNQSEELGSMTFSPTTNLLASEMATLSLKSLCAAITKLGVGISLHEARMESCALAVGFSGKLTTTFPWQPGKQWLHSEPVKGGQLTLD